VHVRNCEDFRCGVDDDWYSFCFGDGRDGFHVERIVVGVGVGKDVNHRGARPECGFEFRER